MPRKRHTAEEVVAKLRQADVLTAQGQPVSEAIRTIGVTKVTYYRRLAAAEQAIARDDALGHAESTVWRDKLAQLINSSSSQSSLTHLNAIDREVGRMTNIVIKNGRCRMKNHLAAPVAASILDIRWMMIVAAVLMTGAIVSASHASAQSCQALWVERNSYYKEAGYCFKTPRAISYFGNAGCIYYNEASVPLSRAVRARIAEITWIERSLGCN
jgi:hypothetical protein